MALTARQQAFVAEYLVDLNGTQAAIRAGYARKGAEVTASKLLRNPKVAEAVDAAKAARSKRVGLTADRVLRELERVALADIGEAFDDSGGVLSVRSMPEDLRRAVSGVDVVELPDGGGLLKKVKTWDKVRALELAMKHLGLIKDKHEHELTGAGWAELVEASFKGGGSK